MFIVAVSASGWGGTGGGGICIPAVLKPLLVASCDYEGDSRPPPLSFFFLPEHGYEYSVFI